jgi:hypothetical protein
MFEQPKFCFFWFHEKADLKVLGQHISMGNKLNQSQTLCPGSQQNQV